MAHDGIHLHGGDGDDGVAFGIKGGELAVIGGALQHEVVPAVGGVAAVAQLAAERGPEYGDEGFGRSAR